MKKQYKIAVTNDHVIFIEDTPRVFVSVNNAEVHDVTEDISPTEFDTLRRKAKKLKDIGPTLLKDSNKKK